MNNKLKAVLVTGGLVAAGLGSAAWQYTKNNQPSSNTNVNNSATQSGENKASDTSSIDSIDYDCGDFGSHNEAQDYFESQGGSPSNNVDRLDRDGDGLACELN